MCVYFNSFFEELIILNQTTHQKVLSAMKVLHTACQDLLKKSNWRNTQFANLMVYSMSGAVNGVNKVGKNFFGQFAQVDLTKLLNSILNT